MYALYWAWDFPKLTAVDPSYMSCMDVEIVADGALQSVSSQDNTAIEIQTQTGADPDALPTAERTVTYAIPTATGVYNGAVPSGTY